LDDEDMILWQDVLDAVSAGRTSDLACPFCKRGVVQVSDRGRVTRLECPACRKFIEGSMQG
jgi:hypothetical protein